MLAYTSMSEKQRPSLQEMSPTICILPFISVSVHATGHLTRCQMSEVSMGKFGQEGDLSEHLENEKYRDLRKKMIEGHWDSGCDRCQLKESRGLKSKRTHWKNLVIAKNLWTDSNLFKEKDFGRKIYHLDIAFNNFCNFKCRMCSSAYSQRWVDDERWLVEQGMRGGSGGGALKLAVKRQEHRSRMPLPLIEDLVGRLEHVKRIEVLGGEPLMSPEFEEFLQLCEEQGIGQGVELMVTTNGSLVSEKWLHRLSSFSYVNLNISIDATGSLFEYMRSSGTTSWSEVDKNVKMAIQFAKESSSQNKVFKINLNGAFQTYNLNNIQDYLFWIVERHGWAESPSILSKHRGSFEHRILVGPKHLSVLGAPEGLLAEALVQLEGAIKEYPFLGKISERSYLEDIRKSLIQSRELPSSEKNKLWHRFCWYTSLLDERRGESLKAANPLLASYVIETCDTEEYRKAVESWKSFA